MKKTIISFLWPFLSFCVPVGGILSLTSAVGLVKLTAQYEARKKKVLLVAAALLCAVVAVLPGCSLETWLRVALFLLLIPAAFLQMPTSRKKSFGFGLYIVLCVVLAVLNIRLYVPADDMVHTSMEQLRAYHGVETTVSRLDAARCIVGFVTLLLL